MKDLTMKFNLKTYGEFFRIKFMIPAKITFQIFANFDPSFSRAPMVKKYTF